MTLRQQRPQLRQLRPAASSLAIGSWPKSRGLAPALRLLCEIVGLALPCAGCGPRIDTQCASPVIVSEGAPRKLNIKPLRKSVMGIYYAPYISLCPWKTPTSSKGKPDKSPGTCASFINISKLRFKLAGSLAAGALSDGRFPGSLLSPRIGMK